MWNIVLSIALLICSIAMTISAIVDIVYIRKNSIKRIAKLEANLKHLYDVVNKQNKDIEVLSNWSIKDSKNFVDIFEILVYHQKMLKDIDNRVKQNKNSVRKFRIV